MMKIASLCKSLIATVLAWGCLANANAQEHSFEPVSQQETAKLRAAVEANPNDLEAHKAYLKTFATPGEAKDQYEKWMKKYPKSAAVPQALGEKYGTYSPDAAQYLLKAVEIQPGNVEVWEKLALDAAFRGDNNKRKEYIQKAIAADPNKVSLRYAYVNLFREDNVAEWKKKTFELAKKYPDSEETRTALHMMGYNTPDLPGKIAIWEQLRDNYAKPDELPFQVAMSRLTDAYIQTGQYAKAIQLAETYNGKAAARLGFAEKLNTAKILADADAKMKAGKYEEAKNILVPLYVRSRDGFDVGSYVLLTKASALDITGATQAAYDGLITFQATTPIPPAMEALEKYGSKLGKSPAQVKQELRDAVAKNSKPALPFELDSYTSKEKVKLDDLKGKVVLLSFWYPGCGPCRAEMPHIEAAIKNIDRSKMVYFGVNVDREQDDFVLPFMKGTGYSFTPLGASKAIIDDYNIMYSPFNLIIDKDGKIAYSKFMVGASNEKMLEMMVQSLL